MTYTTKSSQFKEYCDNVKIWIERFAERNSYIVEDHSTYYESWFKINLTDDKFLAIHPKAYEYGFCCDVEYVLDEWGSDSNFRDLIFSHSSQMEGLTRIVNNLRLNHVKGIPDLLLPKI